MIKLRLTRWVPGDQAGERWPTFETWDRICKTFGWPQTFVK